jgi:HJR/Mrr/RecB family endonuclease
VDPRANQGDIKAPRARADLIATGQGETVVVQCKRYWAAMVGEPGLRDLYGALHHAGANRAILVTTGRLTRGALQWASGKPVETWDGHELVRHWPAKSANSQDRNPQELPIRASK